MVPTAVPFSRPTISEAEINAACDVLRSGWLTSGKVCEEFEREFARYVGGQHAIAVSSATAGIALALAALDIGPGDEVICPVYTFASPAMEVWRRGATPIFVDVDPVTLCPSIDAMEAAVTPATRALMIVHFAGMACDMERVQSIALTFGIPVIEDAAHALPTRFGGVRVGGHASAFTVFSFYANKTITTGEGGMVVTPNEQLAKRVRQLRLHGIDRDVFDRYRSASAGWEYDIVCEGHKANLPDVLAAVGLEQLRKCDTLHARRCRIASRYFEELAGLPILLPAVPTRSFDHAWHLFVIRVDRRMRGFLIEFLRARGIGVSVHFKPMHLFSFWQRKCPGIGAFPAAEQAFEEVISLPIFPGMLDTEQTYVIDALRKGVMDYDG